MLTPGLNPQGWHHVPVPSPRFPAPQPAQVGPSLSFPTPEGALALGMLAGPRPSFPSSGSFSH